MSQTILSIDPGPEQSAFVVWDGNAIGSRGKIPNQSMFLTISECRAEKVVIEQIAAMGMAVGAEVFETVFWSGRFAEFALETGEFDRMKRHEVKMHLCGDMRAKDGNIRQALIDRFGGQNRGIGAVKCKTCKGRKLTGLGKKRGPCGVCEGSGWEHPPGPLQGIVDDVWQALALAITYYDQRILAAKQS